MVITIVVLGRKQKANSASGYLFCPTDDIHINIPIHPLCDDDGKEIIATSTTPSWFKKPKQKNTHTYTR